MFHRRWIYDLLSFNSYLLSPIRTKHNPPLAPMTNGGLTSRLDYSICLPRAFLDLPFGCWGHWELRGLPIHKTSLHADVCSGCYQNLILVWLIIVRYVSSLGIPESHEWTAEESERFRIDEISELSSPWDSLLSCDYNVQ